MEDPKRIGKYELEDFLGGGMSHVYKARDTVIGRTVADNPTLTSHTLAPVDSFRAGASPYGVLQMAGNAWEFVDEPVTPSAGALQSFAKLLSPPPAADEPWYTIHGGAFDLPLIDNAAFEWSAVPFRFRAPDIGFRCAKDAR